MTFRQERLIIDDGRCVFFDDKLIVKPYGPTAIELEIWGKQGFKFITEAEYLDSIAAEGWVLHTANYCVLGKQECHYFLFVKE